MCLEDVVSRFKFFSGDGIAIRSLGDQPIKGFENATSLSNQSRIVPIAFRTIASPNCFENS